MERQRARGRRASVAAYLRTVVRRYYRTDRRRPALTLRIPGQPPVNGLFMGVVTNSSPWTYLGSRPVRPAHADFSSGLDLFAMRRLRTLTTLAALGHMMHSNEGDSRPGGTWSARPRSASWPSRPTARSPFTSTASTWAKRSRSRSGLCPTRSVL